MLTSRWILVAVLSLFFVLGPAGTVWAQSYDSEEQQFLELINQYRQQNGLDPLLLSTPLSVAAGRHSEDMGTYGFFSHTTQASSYYPVGADHTVRIAQEGYDYNTYTAENIAYGQASAQEVFEAWRTSPEHNVNMLGDYAVIGIGLVSTNGTPYWTTDFGAYVDPSASGGNSGDTSADTPGTTPDNTATPASEPTTSDSLQTPQENTGSPAPEATPSAPKTITPKTPAPRTVVGKSAAEQQYARKTARESAAQSQYAEQTAPEETTQVQRTQQAAAEDQYSQETPDTAIGVQKQATPGKAPAPAAAASTPQSNAPGEVPTPSPAAQSSTPEATTKAPTEAPGEYDTTVSTEQPEITQAGTTQTDVDQTGEESEGLPAVLPDTGGWPLVLVLGGTMLAGCALIAARRVF